MTHLQKALEQPRLIPELTILWAGGWTTDLLRDLVILSTNFLTKSPHLAACFNYFTESPGKKKKKKDSAQKNSCEFIKLLKEATMILSYFAKLCIGEGRPIKINHHTSSSYNLQTKLFITLYSLLNTCKEKVMKSHRRLSMLLVGLPYNTTQIN